MLDQLAIAEVDNAMLGSIIVISGSLLILLTPLKHFTWGPISDTLKRREDKAANGLDPAEQSRISSTKMEQEREQQLLTSRSDAADIIKNARESGELSRRNILKDVQEEATRLESKTQANIAVGRNSVLNFIKDDIAELPLQAAEKTLSRESSPEMHESLVNQYIGGLDSSNEIR